MVRHDRYVGVPKAKRATPRDGEVLKEELTDAAGKPDSLALWWQYHCLVRATRHIAASKGLHATDTGMCIVKLVQDDTSSSNWNHIPGSPEHTIIDHT